jgi:adenosylcobinamide-GDP ribazoletransferase
MFSKIPMPQINWDKANMKYSFAALPLVGAVVGGLMWLWLKFSPFGIIFAAAVFTFLPVAITGGIHLDGFCDTMDALSSHAPAEKKREILKDPHSGAFAVIWVCIYFILFFGISTEIKLSYSIIAIPVMSRAAGAFGSLVFKSSRSGVILETFRNPASKISVIINVLFFLAGTIFAPISAAFMITCVLYVNHMSKKEFDGMSGDIAGFLISICEISGLMGVLIWQFIFTGTP